MKYFLIIVFLFMAYAGFSQTQDRPLVQFSGIIYNTDTAVVVPFVTIIDRTNGNKAFSANYLGSFSFVVREGDTVIFNSVGYRREALVIPKNLPDQKFTVLVKMKGEINTLPLVTILPWANIDEFTHDFMTMKFADDDLEIARKNMSKDKLNALARTLSMDAGEAQTLNFKNNFINLTNKHMNMNGANPLLNPFAWGALMKEIFNGDKNRSE